MKTFLIHVLFSIFLALCLAHSQFSTSPFSALADLFSVFENSRVEVKVSFTVSSLAVIDSSRSNWPIWPFLVYTWSRAKREV